MRDDFAKLLTERERIHHADHYHNYRNVKGPKGLNDEYFGGRESMRVRYNHGYDRKSFNENLNPLKGWLRSCIGKKWDKCYSELRKKFDARKVVNAHILQHLYQYIETKAFLNDKGQTVFISAYRYDDKRERPIKESSSDYYVCPKNGTVKVVNKVARRTLIKQREAEKQRAVDAVMRIIDEHNELHFVDGIWYLYTLKARPAAVKTLHAPITWTSFADQLKWKKLSRAEQETVGRWILTRPAVMEITPPTRRNPSADLYYASRQTANHKLLKQHGIDGTAQFDDDVKMSHREAGKYRIAA